jgi:flagellar biogenesis protein FliO
MSAYRRCAALIVVLMTAAGPVWAAGRPASEADPLAVPVVRSEPLLPEYRPAAGSRDDALAWDGLRGLMALGGVLLLIGVGARAIRRWPGLLPRQVRPEGLQLVGRLPLSTKESVCLVRIGHEVLVVGVAAGGLTLLHRLTAAAGGPGTGGGAAAREEEARLPATRFREVLSRLRDVQAAWGVGATDEGAKP